MAHFEFYGGAVMVFQGKINAEIRAYILCKKGGNLSQIQQQTGVSRAQIYRIWKAGVDGLRKKKTTIGNRGRPGKLSKRHKDYIIRELPKLRKTNPNWTIKALQEATNSFHVSQQCISNFLHKSGYGFLQSRKKGLLSPKDLKQRVEFAKKMIKCNDSSTFWRETIAFYFDGVSFAYKKNPKVAKIGVSLSKHMSFAKCDFGAGKWTVCPSSNNSISFQAKTSVLQRKSFRNKTSAFSAPTQA